MASSDRVNIYLSNSEIKNLDEHSETNMTQVYLIKNNDKFYTGEASNLENIAIYGRVYDWSTFCFPEGGTLEMNLLPAGEITLPFMQPITLPLSFELEPTQPGKWEN